MKKIIHIIMILCLLSCATTKNKVVEEVKIKSETESSDIRKDVGLVLTDTTKVTNTDIRITKIEFFSPDEWPVGISDAGLTSVQVNVFGPAMSSVDDKTGSAGLQEGVKRRRPPDVGNRPVKSITIVDIHKNDSSDVRKADFRSVTDSSGTTAVIDQEKERKAVRDAGNGLSPFFIGILVGVVLIIAFFIFIWRRK